MNDWDRITARPSWTIPATPSKKRVDGLPMPDNALDKKSHYHTDATDDAIDTDSFSLADITPEQAETLILLPLMQSPPPPAGGLGLAELKQALEKRRFRRPLTPEESDALELAGEIVHSALPPEHGTGEARYHAEELTSQIEEFVRTALHYTMPRHPLLA